MHKCLGRADVSAILVAGFLLSACSTSVHLTRDFDQKAVHSTSIKAVTIRAKHLSGATRRVISNLKGAILARLPKTALSGKLPANLDVFITRANFSNSTSRLLIGAFSGMDRLHVSVTLMDANTNRIIASFDVTGDYNPGGLGTFATPEKYTANNVAEALVNKLYGPD
jgi:hypothetical protein